MIKAVFFDLDGVLTLNSSALKNTCYFINQKTGVPLKRLERCYKKYDPLLDLGKIMHKDMWNDFCKCIGKNIDIEILIEAFKSTPKNEKVFRLVKKLKEKSYKLGIISDSGRERFNILIKEFKFEDIFHLWILPFEVGSTKSKKKIFKKAINSLYVKPEESIFIDNKKYNLISPKEIGMHTVYHNDKNNDISILTKKLKLLGVKI